MFKNEKIFIGKSNENEIYLLPKMANRHGLITGASGTGKTVTSKVMAESFSDAGIPVFMADVKGDLSGTALAGEMNDNIKSRVEKLNLEGYTNKGFPVRFFDVYKKSGHPIRTKISSVGPDILSIMLGLTEVQESVLNLIFRICKDENLELTDLKDLKKALQYIGENRNNYLTNYGNITTQSIGVIQRCIMTLENQGADNFFGEPALDIRDFLCTDYNGKGIINILDAVELYKNPDLYASIMLWILTELYNIMPEVGDVERPKIVFFFDEAYFLFREMPPYRLKQIEKIVRLIRSKGIGLYFISHSSVDIPNMILEQLGNRIQHNLRAYSPQDQKIAKAAADSFRPNPNFKTYETILELANGEALVSFQNENGEPSIVERVTILPPQSKMGIIDDGTRNNILINSPLYGKYDSVIDNESAYETISKQMEEQEKIKQEELKQIEEAKAAKEKEKLDKEQAKEAEKKKKEEEKAKKNSIGYKLGKKVANQTTNTIIRKGVNSVLKNLFK